MTTVNFRSVHGEFIVVRELEAALLSRCAAAAREVAPTAVDQLMSYPRGVRGTR